MLLKNILFFFFVTTSILIGQVCIAQRIELKNVAKIEFTTHGGGLSSYYRDIEVIRNGDSWHSYQTKVIQGYNKLTKRVYNDSSKIFIKKIPESVLKELLALILKPDTSIKLDLFNLDQKQLIKYIDTDLITHKPISFKSVQRAAIVKAIQSKDTLQQMLTHTIIPAYMMDDKTYYSIILTDKKSKSDTIYAYSFADLYYLPWMINGSKSYNPRISLIYNFISGNENFEKEEKNQLYERMDRWLYQTYFETNFNWNNLKTEQPEAYKLLEGTLTPTLLTSNKWGHTGFFKSSRLPSYIKISFGYMTDSTLASVRYKKFEDTLVGVFRQDNFLITYLNSRESCRVLISPGKMGESGKAYFRDIQKYFPAIAGYDYKEAQLFNVVEVGGVLSTWIILPDGKVILIKYTGELNADNNGNFKGIRRDNSRKYQKQNYVCIVFNGSGNKIWGNNTPAYIGEY